MNNLIAFPTIVTKTKMVHAKEAFTTTVGSKYQATKDMDIAEVAKLVRADIKAAIKAGQLAAGKYGVTIERFSMGQALNVKVAIPGLVDRCPERMAALDRGEPVRTTRTDAAEAVIAMIEGILGAYNRAEDHGQSDYHHTRFYAHVRIA